MAQRKDLSPDNIDNLVRENSQNELHSGELSCSNLDSNEDIRLGESDCEESAESSDVIGKIPINSDKYIPLGITHNGYRLIVMFLADLRLEMFCDQAVVQQASRNIMSATRGLLATDHVILNHGQVTWTTPELAPPSLNYHTTPT
ncbi:hypothetical protein TNCV_2028301 [Trichonephila clavipes]|nr:hypothetical protein TNCV_2028301 [Trichonephila clavipes]